MPDLRKTIGETLTGFGTTLRQHLAHDGIDMFADHMISTIADRVAALTIDEKTAAVARLTRERDEARAENMQLRAACASLKEQREIDSDPDTSWQIVPVHPTDKMLAGARNGLRNLINSVPPDERERRWGEPVQGRGYAVPQDEKHAARYANMLLNAPKPPTTWKDRIAEKSKRLAAAEAERDEARAVLREMEWINGVCQICREKWRDGHTSRCTLSAALPDLPATEGEPAPAPPDPA